MNSTNPFFLIFLFVLLNFSLFASAYTDEANKAFAAGDYVKALNFFQQELDGGALNCELYYNLGTCYAKLDQLDQARLYLEKAVLLRPANKEIRKNIKWIKTELSESMAPLPEFYPKTLWNGIAAWLPFKVWYLVSFFFLVLAAFFVWKLLLQREKVSRSKSLKSFLSLSLVFALCTFLLAQSRWKQLSEFDEYVVMETTTELFAQPEITAEVIQKMEPGSKVNLESELGDWRMVIAEDGAKGWMKAKNLIIIDL